MPVTISGTSGITFPAGGTGNPAGTVVGTSDTQTLTNKTLTSPSLTTATLTTPNIDSAQIPTVSGTAPLYMCRAWVNFNGTGTVAIRASGNVSSITDNGVGKFGINFTTAMPDANYSVIGTQNYSDDNADTALNIVAQIRRITTPLTTTTANVMTSYNQTLHDPTIACFAIFR